MKIEKPYDATRVVALRRMVIDLGTLDYIVYFIDKKKKKTGLEDKENAINIMEQFYDKDAQDKFGVVGIVVENVED